MNFKVVIVYLRGEVTGKQNDTETTEFINTSHVCWEVIKMNFQCTILVLHEIIT